MSARSEASTGMSADLRLVGVAAGTWLASLAGLYLSAGRGALVASGEMLGAGLVAWLLRHRWRWVVAGILLGAACGAAMTAARVAVRDGPAVSRLIATHSTVHMRLIISDDPRPIAGTSGRPGGYVVPASAVDPPVRVLVIATDPAWRTLLPGTAVTATGRLSASRGGDLDAAVLSVPAAPDTVGIAPWSQRAAGALRAGLRRACAGLPAEPGGLLPGLVDGDTSGLDPGVAADFRTTGMTHLVAVSGANVG
jgi:competence protein ComEC